LRRRAAQILAGVAFCGLCFAGPLFADSDKGPKGTKDKDKRVHAPELDVGAAAGALTVIAGTLTLLGERWRRP
jgi:hypothetical protein